MSRYRGPGTALDPQGVALGHCIAPPLGLVAHQFQMLLCPRFRPWERTLPACPECLKPSTQDACAPRVTQRKTGREKPFQPGKKLSIYSIGDTEGRRLTELAQSTGRRIPSFRVLRISAVRFFLVAARLARRLGCTMKISAPFAIPRGAPVWAPATRAATQGRPYNWARRPYDHFHSQSRAAGS